MSVCHVDTDPPLRESFQDSRGCPCTSYRSFPFLRNTNIYDHHSWTTQSSLSSSLGILGILSSGLQPATHPKSRSVTSNKQTYFLSIIHPPLQDEQEQAWISLIHK